ncbi:hypothetical protein PVAP13_9KG381400 [Panicum virgatum]|uniref:Uncharacterized protein n=1 Tax=Panicum virgatum TaxID=38727 RepID=A0A8T0NVK7_PANVG|nr:hypothetical protein PVAP13_9KG381400 [Panicum virgatum]
MRGESSVEFPVSSEECIAGCPQEDYEMLGSPHSDGHRRLDLQDLPPPAWLLYQLHPREASLCGHGATFTRVKAK